jgi:hypothetical protein
MRLDIERLRETGQWLALQAPDRSDIWIPQSTYSELHDSCWTVRDLGAAVWPSPDAFGITPAYARRAVSVALARRGKRTAFTLERYPTLDAFIISPLPRLRRPPIALVRAVREVREQCQQHVEDPREAEALIDQRADMESQLRGTKPLSYDAPGRLLSETSKYEWHDLEVGDVRVVAGDQTIIGAAWKDWCKRRGLSGRISTTKLSGGRVAVRRIA